MTATLEARPDVGSSTTPADFTVTYPDLVDALAACKLAIDSRPPVPILGAVVLDADPSGAVTVASFDYETSVRVTVDATVATPGRLVLDYASMQQYLRALARTSSKADLRSVAVWFTAGHTGATMAAAGFTFPIRKFDADQYPQLPAPARGGVTVDGAAFTSLAGKLAAIADTGAANYPALTGTHLHFTNGGVELVATDRFRLGVQQLRATGRAKVADMLIPAKILSTAAKLLPGDRITIGRTRGVEAACLTSGRVQVTVRLLECEYINYGRLIPGEFAATFSTERKALSSAVAVLSAVDNRRPVKLALRESGCDLSGRDHDVERDVHGPHLPGGVHADNPESIDGINGNGDVYLKAAYLAAALASIDSDAVTVGIASRGSGAVQPILLADSVGSLSDPAAFRHLVMPARGL